MSHTARVSVLQLVKSDTARVSVLPVAGCMFPNSETIRMIRTDLRQMDGFTDIIGAMCDCSTAGVFTQIDSAAADCGAVELDDLIFHRTSFPPDELSAGRDGDYIWRDLWSAEVPLCHHLLPAVSRSASHEVEAPFLSPL